MNKYQEALDDLRKETVFIKGEKTIVFKSPKTEKTIDAQCDTLQELVDKYYELEEETKKLKAGNESIWKFQQKTIENHEIIWKSQQKIIDNLQQENQKKKEILDALKPIFDSLVYLNTFETNSKLEYDISTYEWSVEITKEQYELLKEWLEAQQKEDQAK